jgi:uncharacterized protein YecA (UPF0149 family)
MGFLNNLFSRPPQYALQLGRNKPCWCGSGKKYKHCHYESDQRYFASVRNSTCRGST